MTTNRAYLIIPKLIEQPTWGGKYIMKAKGWSNHPDATRKIGQSYELYSGSYLSLATDTSDPSFRPEIDDIPQESFQIEQIRSEYEEGLLGTRGIKKYGGQLKTLIKFTQAKGNSFQLHVKEPDGSWLPKPESWYFFKKGMATLGIQNKKNMSDYKTVCTDIEKYMQSLSEKVQAGSLSIQEARDLSVRFCSKKNPYRFVNTVTMPKDSVVNLYQGGTHHSWEEDSSIIPQGNILYEVQVDVADDVSTLRSFDKGKIQDDGTIRPLQIEEYFRNLDTAKKANHPEILIQKPKQIYEQGSTRILSIFSTPFYHVDKVTFSHETPREFTNTKQETFHHLFVLQGTIDYHDNSIDITVGEGHSLFIPAAVGRYTVKTNKRSASVLKTYI